MGLLSSVWYICLGLIIVSILSPMTVYRRSHIDSAVAASDLPVVTARPRPSSDVTQSSNTDSGDLVTTNKTFHNHSTETIINPLLKKSKSPTTETPERDNLLPAEGSADEETSSSMTIFFILIVVGISIFCVHSLIKYQFHYLPESVAVILLGAVIGLLLMILNNRNLTDWTKEETLDPTTFFLVVLPPIIFESGYSLHKGNFFQNLGSILVFAVFGTFISAMVIGGGVYLLGQAGVAYELSMVESLAFGSLISAVDPVATLAIFSALDAEPLLNMMVFGESILNDAVSIVMSNTVMMLNSPEMADISSTHAFFSGVMYFFFMFITSAFIGIGFALLSALILKHFDLRKTPSLELGMLLIFSYLPYGFAEGVKLSGIMSILFAGITMSHYTHYNLSPITQITVQHTFRTMAFIGETCVFAYLGLAIFSFNHRFEAALVIWSIFLCLIARALNIFPLSFLVNFFREHKINHKMQFIMWFSGLRGAIAYALSLHLEFADDTHHVIVTTTLVIVLFTVVILGGSTMPLLKLLESNESKKHKKHVKFSKTEEMGSAVDADHLSELTEEEYEVNYVKPNQQGFVRWDTKYFIPFFTRRFTHEELHNGQMEMKRLTNRWYSQLQGRTSETDEEEL
ncbi:sodium/hydrogen exchanger 8-like [Antedon mediterranea]|uniref:sodium/hydrogen exchanger 8-like n=1 Tax=Antedon mediterranea TaxID=105859 RepID=UPI003AF8B138